MIFTAEKKRGSVFVLSAPSGAGKSTLAQMLIEDDPTLLRSVSFTTRKIREGETDGIDYHFVDRSTFEKMIANQKFAEWANVHGNLYGTCVDTLNERAIRHKEDILLVIDVQGAENLRKAGVLFCGIFLLPPSLDLLKDRLHKRGDTSGEELKTRLSNAMTEIEHGEKFDYQVINDNLDKAFAELKTIITAYRLRTDQRHIIEVEKRNDVQ